MSECSKCGGQQQWSCRCDHMEDLVGQTIISIKARVGEKEVKIVTKEGATYRMFHDQDCCEHVELNEITGELGDLIGSPLVIAEESSNHMGEPKPAHPDSWTWTFYRFATARGGVVFRWLGESNGYYGESVDIHREAFDTSDV